jgi:hypothetical protein
MVARITDAIVRSVSMQILLLICKPAIASTLPHQESM